VRYNETEGSNYLQRSAQPRPGAAGVERVSLGGFSSSVFHSRISGHGRRQRAGQTDEGVSVGFQCSGPELFQDDGNAPPARA